MNNPFTPNFGQVPAQMAGRAPIIESMAAAFEDGVGNPDLCTVFTGARGTGKTALLLQLGRESEPRGWIPVFATAIPGMLEDLYEQAVRKASELVDLRGGPRLKGITLGQAVGVEWEPAPQPTMNWRSRMTDLLEALQETGTGIVLCLDEVDPGLDEVVRLATVYQHFVGEERKVALLMAGLPHRVSSLLAGKSTSFLRRANQVSLGRIPRAEVSDAFRETVLLGGKTIEEAALTRAVDSIDGFPFAMQLVGYRAWNAAGDRERIGTRDVERGIEIARGDMQNRVLRATLDELSPRDIDFLAAMLPDEGASASADIAKRTGMTSGNASTYRKRLLEQGVIEAAGRARARFALPMLREYLPEYLEQRL